MGFLWSDRAPDYDMVEGIRFCVQIATIWENVPYDVYPAKAWLSPHICLVWSLSLLSAWWSIGLLAGCPHMPSKNSDYAAQIHRLIWVFTVHRSVSVAEWLTFPTSDHEVLGEVEFSSWLYSPLIINLPSSWYDFNPCPAEPRYTLPLQTV